MRINGQFIQFSKVMVVVIVAASIILTGFSIFGMLTMCDFTALPDVINGYLKFASIVFAAYSGNSAIEKWISHQSLTSDRTSPLIHEGEEEGDAESRR